MVQNNNKIRIIFMGTPEFAAYSLRFLLESGFSVVAVVTAPDKPAGRGLQVHESAVKAIALQYNIPLLQPLSLKDEFFLTQLKQFHADVFVVVAFRMLPEIVWQMPPKGTLNLHASLLPQYRGAAPINWAIINGEKQTGVTTFFIEKEIDTGNIIFQEKVSIDDDENVGSLYNRLMKVGAGLIEKTLHAIFNNTVVSIPQISDTSLLKPAPKLNKEIAQIQFNAKTIDVYNHVRGLSPYPGAYTFIDIKEKKYQLKIFSCVYTLNEHNHEPGSIAKINNDQLNFYCADGYITVTDLQLEGKKRMLASEFLRGIKLF